MGWSKYRSLTYDHTQAGTADSSNFPLLVSLTDTNLKSVANGGLVTDASGNDIAFYSDSGLSSLMSWELASWDAVNGVIEAWVLISTLSHSVDGVFYLAAGNALVTTFQGGAAGAAWDANFKSVWHLPDGSSLSASDSTTNGNTGAVNGASAIAGVIDGGANFNGSSNYILGANTLNMANATVSAWIYVTANPAGLSVVGGLAQGNTSPTYSQLLELDSSGRPIYYLFDGGTKSTSVSTAVTLNAWNLIAGTNDGANSFCYLNGVQVGTVASSPAFASFSGANVLLGGNTNGGPGYLAQKADEFRISNIARSSSWATADYNSQKPGSTFLTAGPWLSQNAGAPSRRMMWGLG